MWRRSERPNRPPDTAFEWSIYSVRCEVVDRAPGDGRYLMSGIHVCRRGQEMKRHIVVLVTLDLTLLRYGVNVQPHEGAPTGVRQSDTGLFNNLAARRGRRIGIV